MCLHDLVGTTWAGSGKKWSRLDERAREAVALCKLTTENTANFLGALIKAPKWLSSLLGDITTPSDKQLLGLNL